MSEQPTEPDGRSVVAPRPRRRYPTAFAERNRVVLALVGVLVLTGIFLLTFNAASLPLVGGGRTYEARFAEAGGLAVGNEVRVAGVKVGEVTEIDLDGDAVLVTFRASDVDLKDQTRADIKVKTLLGQKYLAITPGGREDLDGAIPLANTTVPFDVTAAFSQLSTTVGEIDTAQLEESFTALSTAFADTPASVRATVEGLSALSRTVASRDTELASLLEATNQVTGTLAARNDEIDRIIGDGALLLDELAARREAVGNLLRGTADLGTQLEGLVADNEETLAPALAELDQVAAILQRNQDDLESALAQLGPYYRLLTAATGNGRWVDAYVCGLYDATGAPALDNSVDRDCQPGGEQ